MKTRTKRINSVSIADASLIAGRDRVTIYRWVKTKKIHAYKDRAGYKWIISYRSLKNYISVKRFRR